MAQLWEAVHSRSITRVQHALGTSGVCEYVNDLHYGVVWVNDKQQADTALHCAAGTNQADVCALLLAHGALVDAMDVNDCTPLLSCSWKDKVDTAACLVAHGANVNASSESGNTLLDSACTAGYKALCAFLLAHGANAHTVCTEDGATTLHRAAYQGRLGIIPMLLDEGVSTTATNDEGDTSLDVAVAGWDSAMEDRDSKEVAMFRTVCQQLVAYGRCL